MFMRWSIDRSCHCIHTLHRGIRTLQAVFLYSIALRGIQAKFVEVALRDPGNDFLMSGDLSHMTKPMT
jgi:hypothetical protein